MRSRAAPLAVVAAAIWVTAAGCRRSPLGEGRDAAADLAVEAPTRGDSRTGAPDAELDVAGDVAADVAADGVADLGTGDRAPTDGSGDAPDAPGDLATTDAQKDSSPTPCTANNECISGFCAQGVCCNTACFGMCTSCALPGSIGVCSAVPSGAPDPLNRCPGSMCDGAGSCMMPSCTADEQCAVGRWCMGGRCLPCAATCSSDAACVGGAICIRRNECSYCAVSVDAGR